MRGFYDSTRKCERCNGTIKVSHYETYDGPGSEDRPHNCTPTAQYKQLMDALGAYVQKHGNRSLKIVLGGV